MEIPMKMDDLELPLFSETPIFTLHRNHEKSTIHVGLYASPMHGMRVSSLPETVPSFEEQVWLEDGDAARWFLIIILGEMIQFDDIIFVEMGWFKYQLVIVVVLLLYLYLLYTQHVLLSHTRTDVSVSWAQQVVQDQRGRNASLTFYPCLTSKTIIPYEHL